jgi:FKBP-type peptidyl-prolyl cis-trans isomerase FkpA
MKRLTILFALVTSVAALACNDEITGLGPPSDPTKETFAATLNVDLAAFTKLASGVYIRDVLVGTGDSVTSRSDTVWVTYTGYLTNGNEFDSGVNTHFNPAGTVTGFREGLQGMRVGGRRTIVIPSELGYGSTSVKEGGKIIIPRQSTLVFQVELLKVHNVAATSLRR